MSHHVQCPYCQGVAELSDEELGEVIRSNRELALRVLKLDEKRPEGPRFAVVPVVERDPETGEESIGFRRAPGA